MDNSKYLIELAELGGLPVSHTYTVAAQWSVAISWSEDTMHSDHKIERLSWCSLEGGGGFLHAGWLP